MSRPSVTIDRARRRIEADVHRAIQDVAQGRRSGGLSLRAMARACGVSRSAVDRMESHTQAAVDLALLAAMAASVGQELRLRAYPSGDPIRDAGQIRLLERLRQRLHPSLTWRTEVPLAIDGDWRAWDATIQGDRWRLAVDAETVLDDLQALERRLNLKQRDDAAEHVLLIVADTRRNRRALASAPSAFAGLSRDARSIMRALSQGRDPAASAVILL